MNRSLIATTLTLVGVVVLVVGAALLWWVTQQDRATARAQRQAEQAATERAFRDLQEAHRAQLTLLAEGVSQGAQRRLRSALEQEPLGLYRDPEDPSLVDLEALTQDLVSRARTWRREEADRLAILQDRLAQDDAARAQALLVRLRAESRERAAGAESERSRRLLWHLGLLLLTLAALLAGVLAWLVVRPLRRTQRAVNELAEGALDAPVPQPARGARELRHLARDVESMRVTLAQLTTGLEAEVARKTATLEATLEERTAALEELERTRGRLVQSAKMAGLGTLAGGVAHEFNNLLGGIMGCIESAAEDPAAPEAKEDLAVASRTAERASTLVRALLDVARPGERALVGVDLRAVVGDVVQAARPSAMRRGVTLHCEGEGAVPVTGDAGQLHQVVLNLVTNALQAVSDGGRVEVRLHAAAGGSGPVLEVHDDGPGVPDSQRDRLFEPFYTTREDGTGLGLFVSFGIVERHGGALSVGDSPLGGARFRMGLPVPQ